MTYFPVEEEDLNSSTEKEGVEIFFFPDESNSKRQPPESMENEEGKSLDYEEFRPFVPEDMMEAKPTILVAKDLGDPTSTPKPTPRKSKRKKVRRLKEVMNDLLCLRLCFKFTIRFTANENIVLT